MVVLALVVRRETEEMERSSMYITLLHIAIELCGFLSDIIYPENPELVSYTVSQLDKECCQAVLEHNHRVFEENRIICEEIQRRNRELIRAKIEGIHKQIAERTLAEYDSDSQEQVANGTMANYVTDELTALKSLLIYRSLFTNL